MDVTKPKGKVGRPRKNSIQKATQNSYEGAIGYPSNGAPFFGNQNPFAPQISQTNTIFQNMRWYMISNMRQPLSEAYVELGLIQAVVDVPVDDALRGGITIQSKQLDETQIKHVQVYMDQKDDLNKAGQAAKWNRLYGGAGLLILLDDQDPEEPLNVDSITEKSGLEFRAGDMWEFFWDKQNTEGYDPGSQMDDFEYYSYYSEQVHKSRVLKITGIEAPSFVRPRLRGWGFSVVEPLIRSINQYLKATDVAFEVLDEFKVDFYKIKNLVNTLMNPDAASKVANRIRMMNWQKNYQNAVVMDSEDDHDGKQLSFAGLAETMQQIRMQVASDMRMPITKLFGTTASTGLGNTDQNDMENYNSMVESQVRNKLKYHILKMVELRCQELYGFIPDDLEIDFKPLRILTAEQEENVKTQKFNRLLAAKTAGEIDSKDFRDACNKDNLLSIQLDTTGDGLSTDDPDEDPMNPNNPEEHDAAAESGSKTPPGADEPPDMSSPRADWEYGGEPAAKKGKGSSEEEGRKRRGDGRPYNPEPENKAPKNKAPKNNPPTKNSIAFDLASYRADGGDRWTTHAIMEKPSNVDPTTWEKAKAASRETFGKVNLKFVAWKYKQLGGKLGEQD